MLSARCALFRLNQGIAPDGKRVVSAENLTRTWQPGVRINPTTRYGMGWMVMVYKGQRLLIHTGGTGGFSAVLAFLPDAKVGVAVLTNAGQSNSATSLPTAVSFRLFELLFGQSQEVDARLRAAIEADRAARAEIVEQLRPDPAAASLAPYLGRFTNEALGEVTLTLADDKLMLDVGEFTSQLRNIGEETFVLWDPPLARRADRVGPG